MGFPNKNSPNAHGVTPQTPNYSTTTITIYRSHAIFAKIAEDIGPKEALSETYQSEAEAERTRNDRPVTPPNDPLKV